MEAACRRLARPRPMATLATAAAAAMTAGITQARRLGAALPGAAVGWASRPRGWPGPGRRARPAFLRFDFMAASLAPPAALWRRLLLHAPVAAQGYCPFRQHLLKRLPHCDPPRRRRPTPRPQPEVAKG